MNKNQKTLLIIGAVLVVIIMLFSSTYNGMVKLQENVNEKHADISVQLERRADLIPNLVATVQGYADHEEDIFTAVAEARTALLSAETVEEQAEANAEVTSALGRLLAISEAYPELKADANFQELQISLEGTENRIATARNDYNDVAKEFNTSVKSFPRNLIAGMFGFDEEPYFEASEGSENAPDVNFE